LNFLSALALSGDSTCTRPWCNKTDRCNGTQTGILSNAQGRCCQGSSGIRVRTGDVRDEQSWKKCPGSGAARERCARLRIAPFNAWSAWLRGPGNQTGAFTIPLHDVVWTLGSVSALHHRAFDAELLLRDLPPAPETTDSLITAARSLGFRVKRYNARRSTLAALTMPCVALLWDQVPTADSSESSRTDSAQQDSGPRPVRPALLVQLSDTHVLLFRAGTNQAMSLSIDEFEIEFAGAVYQFAPIADPHKDPDGARESKRAFGFRWFIPELLKHKRVWRDVLIASLFIQLLALGTPIFTQVVIDKVVVHRTKSTLAVLAIGMGLFAIFSALLSWVRQYLVLHTGNRVDAVLGSAVFEHLLKLPPRYFETRPTGVITARLRGVENIREFIASAAVTLVLDLPFLLIFVAIMFAYNVPLTVMALGIIAVIVVLSLLVAPIFRSRLNDQFLPARVIRPLPPNTLPGSRPSRACKWSRRSRRVTTITSPITYDRVSRSGRLPTPTMSWRMGSSRRWAS
jgi:hypothetical protein